MESRTKEFSKRVLRSIKVMPTKVVNDNIVKQLLRSATSIGANYCEANGAVSKQDFRQKVFICKKEAKETLHWLRIIAKANPELADQCRKLWKESHELILIFSSIAKRY